MDTNTSTAIDTKSKWHKRRLIRIFIGSLVLVIVLFVWLFGQQIWIGWQTQGYQAVFLDNGQVYFGKLSATNGWLKLTEIYYLQAPQANQSVDQQLQSDQNVQLVKLGNELHGPTDEMYIERDKVLFWENMKDDSKVVSAIKQYQNK